MSFEKSFEQARALEAKNQLAEAARAYQELASDPQHREPALTRLADLFIRAGKPKSAVSVLVTLVEEHPESLRHCDRLATFFSSRGQLDAAISLYSSFAAREPGVPEAHYNLALLYKKQHDHARAMAAYERALELGISHEHEVYNNMGVLYSETRRPDDACRSFERALDLEPDYVPALFNLASQCEETGDRERATQLYRRILEIEPQRWDALARLAYANRVVDRDDPLIRSLREAAAVKEMDPLTREGLFFALGKALDDAGAYDEAFEAYESANELGRRRCEPYDRAAFQQSVDLLMDWCDADWIGSRSTSLEDAPIFICGMFRSGSTLIEQILARHNAVTAGGELDILPWLLARDMSPYPQRLQEASAADLESLARRYLEKQQALFPGAANVTDKRPENHMHAGLIRAMFPAARIIYTVRQPLDNCLSVYFQQLGANLPYAVDLEDTAHYYAQQERLREHWQQCFPDSVFVVDYDELVRAPEPLLRKLLAFLGLDWDENCLSFEQSRNQVKTASLWQVREPLHTRSSDRWRNYEAAVETISRQIG